jgi:hypothetical protein
MGKAGSVLYSVGEEEVEGRQDDDEELEPGCLVEVKSEDEDDGKQQV